MNHLAPAGEDAWKLARHAHVIVYERRTAGEDADRELLTIYDCAAAQKPPSAQIIGHLVRVDARHEREVTPTGYVVRLREESRLERQPDADGPDGYVIRAQ